MLAEETKRRQTELEKLLREMSLNIFNEYSIESMAIQLNNVYEKGFRHSYADIYAVVVDLAKYEDQDYLEYLSNNLQAVSEYVEQDYISGSKKFSRLYRPLMKLCDHVNLEVGRYNQISQYNMRFGSIGDRLTDMKIELNEASQDLNEAKSKMSSIQTEIIAVLSIFAAIVLTFAGALNFLGNTLSGMAETPWLKASFFILLCGFVLFNAIFLMLYAVAKLTGRTIYARCKSDDCTCGANKEPSCNTLKRLRKRLPYIYWFNVVLVILLAINTALVFLVKLNILVFD